jgi:hypothetical protein
MFAGRLEEAADYAQAAVALGADARYDPFDPAWTSYRQAQAHLLAGRLDRFIEICANLAAQPRPGQVLGGCGLLLALSLAGRAEEARGIAEDTLAAARAHANPFCVALALYASGRAFAPADPARALRFSRDGLAYAQEHRLRMFEAVIAQEAAGLEAAHGDLGQALTLFDAALDSFQRAGNAASLGGTLGQLAVCFDRFDQPDVAATLSGLSSHPGIGLLVVDLRAVVDHVRAELGDAAFDQCAATGSAMDLGEAVSYARHHIELARRQTANPHSRGT